MKSRGLPIRNSAESTQMLAIFSARAGMKPWKPSWPVTGERGQHLHAPR